VRSNRSFLVAGLWVAVWVLGGVHPAHAQGAVRSIVTFRPGVDREAYTENAVRAVGGVPIRHLHLVHALVAQVTPAQARALLRRGDVETVEVDAPVHILDAVYPRLVPAQTSTQEIPWGISWVHAPEAWFLELGDGVRVAVLDTGIALNHPDLGTGIHGGFNAADPGASFNDDNGHGTHVAGTIGARDNEFGVVGVAPACWLYSVKVVNRTGSGLASDLIAGIDWSISHGMQVINMSLGTSANVRAVHEAVIRAYDSGIVLVAAAGNSGGLTQYPAAYQQVISVSAVDEAGVLAYFSSFGKVDLAAPGVNIRSCWLNGTYRTISGTAMAAPHVTGAVALHLHQHPDQTPAQVEAALKSEATPLGSASLYGAGAVNAFGAAQ
jgi:subtilisin family serine protease